MKIVTEISPAAWDKFVAENSSPASFLQTWEWGEFQKSLGLKIHRVSITGDNGAFESVAQAIVRPLYLGKTYLEVTKGPVGKELGVGSWELIIKKLITIGKLENAILIRTNPPYQNVFPQIPTTKFQLPEILLRQTEPNDTVLVDLSKSEDELLSAMHEKSRYNIRLAMKKGVRVEDRTRDKQAFEKFLELIAETAKRDNITVWPRARFEKFRETFMMQELPLTPSLNKEGESDAPSFTKEGDGGSSPRAILLTGEFEGKVLAAAIVMLFGDSGTYLYAASSAEQRNANVPSLVLWEAIRAAKAAGKKYYDMWGIAPTGVGEDHSWAGITRFKSRYIKIGETGSEKHYTGTWDLVLDKKYYTLFKLGKIFRNLLK